MFGKNRSQKTGHPRRPRIAIERLDLADLHFADELPQGRLVELPGRGTAFVRVAEGPAGAPTVLLLHGLMATADLNWSLAVPVLSRRFNVVAPDLRGHGRGMRTRRFSGDECADDLAAIVRTLELGRVIVVGYSLGGLVAQVFVRRHPELVSGVVLCATASKFGFDRFWRNARTLTLHDPVAYKARERTSSGMVRPNIPRNTASGLCRPSWRARWA